MLELVNHDFPLQNVPLSVEEVELPISIVSVCEVGRKAGPGLVAYVKGDGGAAWPRMPAGLLVRCSSSVGYKSVIMTVRSNGRSPTLRWAKTRLLQWTLCI